DLSNGSVVVYPPDYPSNPATTFTTGLTSPQGIAFDQAKNLYVVDAGDGADGNGTIFKYDLPTKTQTVLFTGLSNPIGLTLDGSDLLVAENGAGRVRRVPLNGDPTQLFKVLANPLGLTSHAFNQTGFTRFV